MKTGERKTLRLMTLAAVMVLFCTYTFGNILILVI